MAEKKYIDVAIFGAGPAGLQAALYTSRRKLKTVVFGKPHESALENATIENLVTSPPIKGKDLIEIMVNNVKREGAILTNKDVIKFHKGENDTFLIVDEDYNEYIAITVLFATGISHNKLGIPGEKEFIGRGVSNCIECDANFYKNKDVAVIGKGSAARDGVYHLLNIVNKVYFFTLGEKVPEDVYNDFQNSGKVEIVEDKKPVEIIGNFKVEELKLDSGENIKIDGVFIELGAKGVMDLTGEIMLELDDEFKHIVVNHNMETSYKGVYAAGDITGLPYQVGKAIGQGTISGINMGNYVAKWKKLHKNFGNE